MKEQLTETKRCPVCTSADCLNIPGQTGEMDARKSVCYIYNGDTNINPNNCLLFLILWVCVGCVSWAPLEFILVSI